MATALVRAITRTFRLQRKLHTEVVMICNICGVKREDVTTDDATIKNCRIHHAVALEEVPYNTKKMLSGWNFNPKFCHLCFLSFPTENAFRQHVLAVHTNKLAVSCVFCGRSFKDSTALLSHIKAKHHAKKSNCLYLNLVLGVQRSVAAQSEGSQGRVTTEGEIGSAGSEDAGQFTAEWAQLGLMDQVTSSATSGYESGSSGK